MAAMIPNTNALAIADQRSASWAKAVKPEK